MTEKSNTSSSNNGTSGNVWGGGETGRREEKIRERKGTEETRKINQIWCDVEELLFGFMSTCTWRSGCAKGILGKEGELDRVVKILKY